MSRQPFSAKSKCAKCGSTGASTLYFSQLDQLRRKCDRCDFAWYELPLDRDGVEPPVEEPERPQLSAGSHLADSGRAGRRPEPDTTTFGFSRRYW